MDTLLNLLLFVAFVFLMMRYGCGAHMLHGHGSARKRDLNEKVDHVDPICGMTVQQDQGYGKMYQGKLYRFCSKNCLNKFDEAPEKYAPSHDSHTRNCH